MLETLVNYHLDVEVEEAKENYTFANVGETTAFKSCPWSLQNWLIGYQKQQTRKLQLFDTAH